MKKSIRHDRPFLMDVTLLREKVPSWEEYLFNLPVVKNLETLSLHRNVTFIIGENGTGKSTLLEAVAMGMGFNPEGGSRKFRYSAAGKTMHACAANCKNTLSASLRSLVGASLT